jgi:cell division septation protein DedD
MQTGPDKKGDGMSSSFSKFPRFVGIGGIALALTACQPGEFLNSLGSGGAPEVSGEVAQSVKMIERDVEAPEVYQRTDPGLWDGRPSLGGVWVAGPDVTDPERVIIRNTANDRFVIGALFRRERENPGPPLQLSSDAAAALGILAGAPTEIDVIALRREEVPDPDAAPLIEAPAALGDGAPIEAIAASPLDDPIAAAAAALDRAEAAATPSDGTPQQRPDATATPAPVAPVAVAAATPLQSSLDRPFLQVGIFSVEQNASNTATALRGAGIIPTVLEQESSGKTFWRVVVGPSRTSAERAAVLRTIKGLGFEDAYAVTN